jgi:NTP pyrophosphatase (non-canonical NTP hydrolase)
MTLNEYQEQTRETAIYPKGSFVGLLYLGLGLASEAGEVAGVLKKTIRDVDSTMNTELEGRVLDEIGDTLWYISELCTELGTTLNAVALHNLTKLKARQVTGTLKGFDDNLRSFNEHRRDE